MDVDPRLHHLLGLLDHESTGTVGTSIRVPANLREAIDVAAELGLSESTSELTVRGLRDALEAFAQRALLDAHYRDHPEAQPDLGEIAVATAELDDNPLAKRPELIRRAAEAVIALRRDATPDDVLMYAAGLAASAA